MMVAQVPEEIRENIQNLTGELCADFSPIGGGCINNGGKLNTTTTSYFLKWNNVASFPGMFRAEARGLQILQRANAIRIPGVISVGEAGRFQYLLLEFVASGRKHSTYWRMFGEQLAALHRTTNDTFGLDHHNFIGSLPQQNFTKQSWIDFFIECRLVPQLQLISDNASSLRNKFEILFKKLPELLPVEPPSLQHGDLWSGNLITDERGDPVLIDPAVSFGNRECDLAMTQLFGGFDNAFFDSYNERFPLTNGYWQRFDIYNLYPLLVHVNLFGKSYWSQVVSILHKFV